MTKAIGKAKLLIGKKEFVVDVYGYENYRTIFISDEMKEETHKTLDQMPKHAQVKDYLGKHSYKAEKFGNPHNKIPSYDFQINNKTKTK